MKIELIKKGEKFAIRKKGWLFYSYYGCQGWSYGWSWTPNWMKELEARELFDSLCKEADFKESEIKVIRSY